MDFCPWGFGPASAFPSPWYIFCAPILTQMVFKLPQGHEGSEYVLSFEIGQREGVFYSVRTDTQNHPVRILI